MKPFAVEVGGPKAGVLAAFKEVAVTWAKPLIKLVRVVVIVAVEEVLAATPLTVTKPLLDIATVPFAVAVAA